MTQEFAFRKTFYNGSLSEFWPLSTAFPPRTFGRLERAISSNREIFSAGWAAAELYGRYGERGERNITLVTPIHWRRTSASPCRAFCLRWSGARVQPRMNDYQIGLLPPVESTMTVVLPSVPPVEIGPTAVVIAVDPPLHTNTSKVERKTSSLMLKRYQAGQDAMDQ